MTAIADRGVAPLHRVSRALGTAGTIAAAKESGVLAAIATGATAAEVAATNGFDERAASHLLGALVDLGVAEWGPAGRCDLSVSLEVLDVLDDLWAALPRYLRTGEPHRRLDDATEAGPGYGLIAAALGAVEQPALAVVTDAFGDPGRRLLDLGAGTAPWSRRLAARHPDLTVTAVELPGVAPHTRAAIAADGLEGRIDVVAGDLHTVALDGLFDTVLVANVCRLFGEDAVRRLLGRAAGLTAPGGRIVLLDVLPDGDRPGDGSIGLYALGLALRTGTGGVHPFSAYAAWLYDAGYMHIEAVSLGQPELSMIRAARPG